MPGAGKTTAARLLADKLGYKHLSGGDLRGKIALRHNLTIDQLNEIGKKEIWTDKEVDDELVRIGKEEDNYVIDSWIAFYFIPKSVKIFLDVNPRIGAERVFKVKRPDEDKKDSVEETEKLLKKRVENTNARYIKYYKKNFLEKSNYDLIIDTSKLSINQVAGRILEFIKIKS